MAEGARKDGVSAWVWDAQRRRVLGGFRRGSHGAGDWATPGGHVEGDEAPGVTASRELAEETGLHIEAHAWRLLCVTTDDFAPGKQYRTHHWWAPRPPGAEPQLLEPDKCMGWEWRRWADVLEEPKLFLPMRNFFAQPPWAALADMDRFVGQAILLSGCAGSGKGTQGQRLAESAGLLHVSTGELYRREVATGSAVGARMHEFMVKGAVVPDADTFPFLRGQFAQLKYRFGFLLDGYPKNESSRVFLEECFAQHHIELTAVLFFDVPAAVATERLEGRWMCVKCERNYHAKFAPPVMAGTCDGCGGPLSQRPDDKSDAIASRLAVFEKVTAPLLAAWRAQHVCYRVDATHSIAAVTQAITAILSGLTRMRTDSSYVIGARTVKAATFHNHVDACTHALVRHLCTLTASSATPHKVYPVSHLQLGPQVTSAQFSRIYASLPNFHAIRNATYEAFATGTMGATMDYDHQVAVLEAASRFPNAGVMTEVEEDILAIEDGRVTFDAGPTPFTLDLTRFLPWEHARVQDAPLWELHHGIDVSKERFVQMPFSVEALMASTSEAAGFQLGGWFIFAKPATWSYRCNEFANGTYADARARLEAQRLALAAMVTRLLPEGAVFQATASLEKVHALWHF